MTRQQLESLFVRRDALMSQHDAAALTALYADEVIVESPMAGGVVHGRAANEEVNRAFFAGFPDSAFTRETLVIDGEHVAWVGEVRGTDTGGFLGIPPTGKPFRLPMVFVFTIKDGLVVREKRVYDFTGMLIQIGVLKAKPL